MYGTASITIFAPNGDVGHHYRSCDDEMGIYDLLVPLCGHEVAADAAAWCGFAPIGEGYFEDDFEIIIEG